MAVTKAHMSDNLKASITYALGKGKMAKNGDHKITDKQKEQLKADGFSDDAIMQLATSKYRAVCRSGNVVLPDNPAIEMKQMWDLKHAKSKYEAEVSIQSFSEQALDPRDPKNWKLANHLGMLTAKKLYYDKQDNPDDKNILYVVYTHIDNMTNPENGKYKTPKIHNHIIAMNCNVKTGKAINYHNQHLKILKASNAVMKENNIPFIEDETAYTNSTKRKTTTKTRAELGVKETIRKQYVQGNKAYKRKQKSALPLTYKEQTKRLINEIIIDLHVTDFESFVEIASTYGLEVLQRRSPIKQGFNNVKFINHNIKNAYKNNEKQQDFTITSRANGFQNYTKEGIENFIHPGIRNQKHMESNIDQLNKINNGNIKQIPGKVEFKSQSDDKQRAAKDANIEHEGIIIIKQQIQAFIDSINRLREKYAKRMSSIKYHVKDNEYKQVNETKSSNDFILKKYVSRTDDYNFKQKSAKPLTNKEHTKQLIDEIIKDITVTDFESFVDKANTYGLDIIPIKSPIKKGFTNIKFANYNLQAAFDEYSKEKDFTVTSRANDFKKYTKEGIENLINTRIRNQKRIEGNIDQTNKINTENINQNIKPIPNKVEFKSQSNAQQETAKDANIEHEIMVIIKQQIQAFIDSIRRFRERYAKRMKSAKFHVKDNEYKQVNETKKSNDFKKKDIEPEKPYKWPTFEPQHKDDNTRPRPPMFRGR